jgi:hypothetical protein
MPLGMVGGNMQAPPRFFGPQPNMMGQAPPGFQGFQQMPPQNFQQNPLGRGNYGGMQQASPQNFQQTPLGRDYGSQQQPTQYNLMMEQQRSQGMPKQGGAQFGAVGPTGLGQPTFQQQRPMAGPGAMNVLQNRMNQNLLGPGQLRGAPDMQNMSLAQQRPMQGFGGGGGYSLTGQPPPGLRNTMY